MQGQGSENIQSERMSQVAEELSRMDVKLASLDKQISMLEDHLPTVLSAPSPLVKEEVPKAEKILVPLAARLQENNYILNTLSTNLKGMIQRIEL